MSLNQNRWIELCNAAGISGDNGSTFTRLVAAYSEPHRRYHNLRHISECQHEFDPVRSYAHSPVAVELAIWFHDAIYDTKAPDNEERSAAWAQEFLREAADSTLGDRVARLVLATKRHDITLDEDAGLLVDVDLSILGQPEKRFWEYETQIRQEYSWVEDAVFRAKRAEILEQFLARERIYSTEQLSVKYEHQARKNLEASIVRLRD